MTTQRARVSRRAILLAAAATAAGFGTSGKSAWAANANWSAAPPGSFWNAPNWDNGGPYTALPGDALFFDTSSITGLNNDFTTGTSFAGITFNPGGRLSCSIVGMSVFTQRADIDSTLRCR